MRAPERASRLGDDWERDSRFAGQIEDGAAPLKRSSETGWHPARRAKLLPMRALALLLFPALVAAQPCLTATEACTGWVSLGGGPSRSMVYRTYSLDARNGDKITRALVVIHGTGRDADNYSPQCAGGGVSGGGARRHGADRSEDRFERRAGMQGQAGAERGELQLQRR